MARRDEVSAAAAAAINAILDPCSLAAGTPTGLVDMGLVTALTVEPVARGWHVRATRRLTDPSCLLGAEFVAAAHRRLSALPGVVDVDVTLDHRHDWTSQDMSPLARARYLETSGGPAAGAPAAGARSLPMLDLR